MLIIDVKEWIYRKDRLLLSEYLRFLLEDSLFGEIFHGLALLIWCYMRHLECFVVFLSLLLFGLITIFVFKLSSHWRQKVISSLEEGRMTKDEFIRLLSRLMKSIHIQLCYKIHTCLMKLLTFLCLKYFGNTSPSKASLFLIMNSFPLGIHCIVPR